MTRTMALSAPSTRLRRSVPNRASSGPAAPLSSRCTKPRTWRKPSSNASHGLRSRQRSGIGLRTVPPAMRRPGIRAPPSPSRLAGSTAWRNASRSADSIGAARSSPSTRARIAARPTSCRSVCSPRIASTSPSPPSGTGKRSRSRARTSAAPTSRRRSLHVRGAGLDGLVLGPVLLIAAELAAVVDAGRELALPLDLVDGRVRPHERTPGREEVVDEQAQARLAVGRRAERRERRVEVAQVGRPQHDLGEQPRQRPGLEAEAPPLPIDRGPGDPAATSVQVGDDVARRGVRLEPGVDEVGWRRRREPFVGGQREPGFRPREEEPPHHRRRLWQVNSAATLDR